MSQMNPPVPVVHSEGVHPNKQTYFRSLGRQYGIKHTTIAWWHYAKGVPLDQLPAKAKALSAKPPRRVR
jgi:hypothetical protein